MFRQLFLNTAFLISLAGTASADFCSAVHQTITYEALITSDDNPSTAMLNQLHETAATLESLARAHRPPLDEPTLKAVQDYAQSNARIRSTSDGSTLQSSVIAHQSGLHRVKIRYLRAFTDSVCSAQSSALASRNPVSALTSGLNFTVKLTLFFVSLTISIAALLGILYVRKRRLALRARHYCNVPAKVVFVGGEFQTQLVDISAIGLKLVLPEGQKVPAKVVVDFFDTKAHGKVAWKNASFVGLTIQPPLSLDLVASVSKGVIARKKSKGKYGKKAAASAAGT